MSKFSPDLGMVSLIGAGPGASGLITLAGRRVLERADVVLYDHLASTTLLNSVSVPGQERIHVGKRACAGLAQQSDINALMVRRAQRGQRVARLKGGDPYLFGRGGEEAAYCVSKGVKYEVIPGVSALSSVLASAGIPLTHRTLASSFTVVTGHERQDRESDAVDWRALAKVQGTLVVFMGIMQVEHWTRELLAGGMAADTPVAFIRWGTTPRQKTLTGTLSDIAEKIGVNAFEAPAIAVLGEVVSLRAELRWFEERPLFGEVIALTRSASTDTLDFELLEDLGATLIHLPLTQQVIIEDAGELVKALREGAFTDIVLTSANGVRALAIALDGAERDARDLHGIQMWCVGPATARALKRALGIRADELPTDASATGLVAHAHARGVDGRSFLFPASSRAHPTLPQGLRGLGAEVREVKAYETLALPNGPADLQSALDSGLSLVALASPSAVDALVSAMDSLGVSRDSLPVAVIGPTTARAAHGAGLTIEVQAETHSMSGLATTIAESTRLRIKE